MPSRIGSPLGVEDPSADLPALVHQLAEINPQLALTLVRSLGGDVSPELRSTTHRVTATLKKGTSERGS
jgi:hypothetical protein